MSPDLLATDELGAAVDVQAVQDALLPDALHPSKEGHMLLARKVAQFMVSNL